MNKYIKEQLNKCTVACVPEFDDNTTQIIIPCGVTRYASQGMEMNKCYIIELENYIIHPAENFNLASNWNKGVTPQSKFLLATPKQSIGKMTKFDACGYSMESMLPLSDNYSDIWLPEKGFKIIQEVKN